jgi:phospholipase/carboxylesterase
MAAELLSCVEIEPAVAARFAVIWLHGLGADGHDFEPIVPELSIDPALGVRFVFPHAQKIPVTVNGGMVMRAWYDIRQFDLRRMHDEQGVRRSVEAVRALVAARERARRSLRAHPDRRVQPGRRDRAARRAARRRAFPSARSRSRPTS